MRSAATKTFEAHPAGLQSRLGEDLIVLNSGTGRYFQLNPVAQRVWELLSTATSLEALATVIAAEYGVPLLASRRDVAELLGDFERDGLLVVRESEHRSGLQDDPCLNVAGVLAGVRLSSNWRLPGPFEPGATDRSVAIYFLPEEQARLEAAQAGWEHPLPVALGVQGCLDRSGARVLIVERPGMRDDPMLWVRRVLPFAAALQGVVMLHASAVRVDNGIHAFIGASGAGKSTLARRLGKLGLQVISDDLLPGRLEQGAFVVPDAASSLAVPIRTLHFLHRDANAPRVTRARLTAADCMVALLHNGFGEIGLPAIWSTQFLHYSALAAQASAYDLTFPDDLSRVDECAGWVADRLLANAMSGA